MVSNSSSSQENENSGKTWHPLGDFVELPTISSLSLITIGIFSNIFANASARLVIIGFPSVFK